MQTKKILIIGAGGSVGMSLADFLNSRGHFINASGYSAEGKEVYALDITDREKVFSEIERLKPEVIIHAAAKSSLLYCEKNPELARAINVGGTKNIVDAINRTNPEIKLIFLSSDYVFDGEKGDYKEGDKTEPRTVYGKTKLEAEKIIKSGLKNYIICRSANIYGRGGNFFNFVVSKLRESTPLDVFSDTFYTPTFIDYFTACVGKLIDIDYRGVIHIAGQEKISRYDFAVKVAEAMKKDSSIVIPMKQPENGFIAKDISLNTELSRKLTGICCPTIAESLKIILKN